jgi:hypothetical protein
VISKLVFMYILYSKHGAEWVISNLVLVPVFTVQNVH